jgi:small redox-active disulfide protein 2
MEIKILGSGCPKCKLLEANAKKAVEDLGKEVKITKVTDINDIIEFGVMSTPAIVIDDEVMSSGKVLTPEEIKDLL